MPWLQARAQDGHIHRDLNHPAQIGVLRSDQQATIVGNHLSRLASYEDSSLLLQPLVKLLIPLTDGTEVNVEVVNPRVSRLHHQMRELEGVHAADLRTVSVVSRIPAPDAMQNGHALRLTPVLQHHSPASRTTGVDHPLELQAGQDVVQPSIAVLGCAGAVEEIEAGSHDDGAHIQFHDLILLLEINGSPRAEFLANAAFASLKIATILPINHWNPGYRLGEGYVYRRPHPYPRIELAGYLLRWTFLLAQATTGTQLLIHITRLLPHLNLEVPYVARYLLHLAIAQNLDPLVLSHGHHLRRQYSSRTI